MTELTPTPDTTVAEFEAMLDGLRARFYEPLAKRLLARVAELEKQVDELKGLHGEACQRAAEADERAKKAEVRSKR